MSKLNRVFVVIAVLGVYGVLTCTAVRADSTNMARGGSADLFLSESVFESLIKKELIRRGLPEPSDQSSAHEWMCVRRKSDGATGFLPKARMNPALYEPIAYVGQSDTHDPLGIRDSKNNSKPVNGSGWRTLPSGVRYRVEPSWYPSREVLTVLAISGWIMAILGLFKSRKQSSE